MIKGLKVALVFLMFFVALTVGAYSYQWFASDNGDFIVVDAVVPTSVQNRILQFPIVSSVSQRSDHLIVYFNGIPNNAQRAQIDQIARAIEQWYLQKELGRTLIGADYNCAWDFGLNRSISYRFVNGIVVSNVSDTRCT